MDKAGHIYTAAHLGESFGQILSFAGYSKKKSALLGGVYGWSYLLGLELLDGNSSKWGFSWSDLGANTLGTILYTSQELLFDKQLFRTKFSYSPSGVSQIRPNVLGSNFTESLFKDYNGQTYWLSFSPFSFTQHEQLRWICLSVGYSVNDKISGANDIFVTKTKIYSAKRQLLFSLDIDIEAMNIKRKWVRTILKPLNWIKIPFPTMEITNGGLRLQPFYF